MIAAADGVMARVAVAAHVRGDGPVVGGQCGEVAGEVGGGAGEAVDEEDAS